MNIVFLGTPEFSIPILKKLSEKYKVVLVVSQPDKRIGRKQILTKTPVKKIAESLNLEVFQPENIKKEYKYILEKKPDLLITAAYGQILPKELLENVKSINVHASLLPKYRGAAPIEYAIKNGDSETGITIMQMVSKMDAGGIYTQDKIKIKPNDTTTTLTKKLSLLGADLLINTIPKLNKLNPIPQDEKKVSYAPQIKFEDQLINWNTSCRDIINHVNSMLDNHVCGTYINNTYIKIFKVKKSDIIECSSQIKPGSVLNIKKKLIVQTKTKPLEILELQVSGKKRMLAKDFLNGQKIITTNSVFERK